MNSWYRRRGSRWRLMNKRMKGRLHGEDTWSLRRLSADDHSNSDMLSPWQRCKKTGQLLIITINYYDSPPLGSCHVMLLHSCLSLSRGVAVSGRGQVASSSQGSLMSNMGFGVLLKDTSTCSSALPGAGIWASDLLITRRPALPAELQSSGKFYGMN